MNCEEIRAKLSLYLDHMLSQKEAQLIAEHLHSCESCEKEAGELSQISRLLGQIPQKPVPDAFWQRMDQALCEEKKRRKNETSRRLEELFFRKRRLWRTVAGAAAVFLVCFLSVSMFSNHLSLPDTGVGQQAQQHLNLDDHSQTVQSPSANQPGQKNKGTNHSDLGSKSATSEPETAAINSKSATKPRSRKSTTAPTAPKADTTMKSPKQDTTKESPKQDTVAAGISVSGAGAPITENQLRSRSLSMNDAIGSAQSDGAVSNLADAVNQKDLKKMEQSVNLAGYTDQLEDRAKVAMSFYQIVFGDDPISWEFVKEEPKQMNTSADAFQQKGQQSSVRHYKLSNENKTLGLSVIQQEDTVTLQEGILQYSYELDQTMAGNAYQLEDYTPQNEEGCPEFTLRLTEGSVGADKTVTFVGCNGKVSRKDGMPSAPANVPDHMEEK